jgi:hypothetical protein
LADRFAFRIGIDRTFDMRRIEAGEVFTHILAELLTARPDPNVSAQLNAAGTLVGRDKRGLRRDLARKALRAAGNASLLVDGLEKADEAAARAVAEELFELSDDAEVVLVVPVSLAYGPGAGVLVEDVRFFPIRPALVRGTPTEQAAQGFLFVRAVALRHLGRSRLGPGGPDQELLNIVDDATIFSGGVPRVVLQLLRDAHRHAIVAKRSTPTVEDLQRAKHDHGEQLRRSLLPGDIDALARAHGQDGSEVPFDRKLRFLLQGHLLEYKLGEAIVMHVAPTLALALRWDHLLP